MTRRPYDPARALPVSLSQNRQVIFGQSLSIATRTARSPSNWSTILPSWNTRTEKAGGTRTLWCSPCSRSGVKPSILRQSSAPDIVTDLARLTDALRVAAGGLIAFAFFDTFPARDSAMREVEQRLAGEVEVRHIELTPAEPYLHEKLHAPPPGRRLAYFVNGFEGLAGDAREQAFGALQVKREAIGRLEVPVVLWVAEENLAAR